MISNNFLFLTPGEEKMPKRQEMKNFNLLHYLCLQVNTGQTLNI